MKSITFSFILLLCIIAGTTPTSARRIRTNNGKVTKSATLSTINSSRKSVRSGSSSLTPTDNLAIADEELEIYKPLIEFSGYDKTASSAKESLCISNNSCESIQAVTIEITYLDMQGRMLHKRMVEIPVSIPSAETRTAIFNHYDPQKSLYFYRSKPPRAHGIPYDITLRLISISIQN